MVRAVTDWTLLIHPRQRSSRASSSEAALSDYYSRFQDADTSPWRFVVRHPVASAGALLAIRRLPRLTAALSGAPEGDVIRCALSQRAVAHLSLGTTGAAVLEVPAHAEDFGSGHHLQTYRRKARSAARLGVTCRPVQDPVERARLLALADEAERLHPDTRYRTPEPDNADLLAYGLWLAAYSPDDAPLLLSVTPVDGEWGLLRYFRTLGTGRAFSDSRYLMAGELVRALAERGVRHLVDMSHPAGLPNGLRYFQRLLGFRIVRVSPRGR